MQTNGWKHINLYLKNMIKIKNKKIVSYLNDKEKLVMEGRQLSIKIEDITKEIEKLNLEEQKITDKVNPKELIERGDALKDVINKQIDELREIGAKIEQAKVDAIPKDMVKKHYALRDEREKLELDRSKVGMKIQKIKDRVIPLIKKEVIPLIGQYEDIESSKVKGDEVIIEIFDRVEEFKKTFKKRA